MGSLDMPILATWSFLTEATFIIKTLALLELYLLFVMYWTIKRKLQVWRFPLWILHKSHILKRCGGRKYVVAEMVLLFVWTLVVSHWLIKQGDPLLFLRCLIIPIRLSSVVTFGIYTCIVGRVDVSAWVECLEFAHEKFFIAFLIFVAVRVEHWKRICLHKWYETLYRANRECKLRYLIGICIFWWLLRLIIHRDLTC